MQTISVEVVYALCEEQQIIQLELDAGSTVGQAIMASGILDTRPEIDLDQARVGVWSKRTTLGDVLLDGDRVEIYRPLLANPKSMRRVRARDERAVVSRRKNK